MRWTRGILTKGLRQGNWMNCTPRHGDPLAHTIAKRMRKTTGGGKTEYSQRRRIGSPQRRERAAGVVPPGLFGLQDEPGPPCQRHRALSEAELGIVGQLALRTSVVICRTYSSRHRYVRRSTILQVRHKSDFAKWKQRRSAKRRGRR